MIKVRENLSIRPYTYETTVSSGGLRYVPGFHMPEIGEMLSCSIDIKSLATEPKKFSFLEGALGAGLVVNKTLSPNEKYRYAKSAKMLDDYRTFYLLYPFDYAKDTLNAKVEISRVIYNLGPDLSDVWLPNKTDASVDQKMYYPPDGDYLELAPM